jgi:lysophospholipase L1-like esterase
MCDNCPILQDGLQHRSFPMQRPRPGAAFAAALSACISLAPARAGETVRCAAFANEALPTPTPSSYPSAVERAKSINQAVKSTRYSIIFFGDSLTEGWNRTVWEEHLAPRGALNAGVGGDRTDNLLWRLHHGNLAGPRPDAVVLLIGTNDLANRRSPELTADGVRAALQTLRHHFPETRILLLGLLPREEAATAPLRVATMRVNHMIPKCADDEHIVYADIGDVLLDGNGRLTPAIAPDGLHFTARGYALLTSRLDPELDRLLGPAR